MDLKQYFRKIKETEAAIEEQFPLIVSLETTDGGQAGIATEVSRIEAARALVENRAILATAEQRTAYFERESARKKAFEKSELAKRVQIAIISQVEPSIKALESVAPVEEKKVDGSKGPR
jgi:hypothetical protein